ncbi:unnamed protein product [Mesocestoides corti]|nr:unnamed protein product [Mesocestoides corti]
MAQRKLARLPSYVDRVPLPRKCKPDTWLVVGVEFLLVFMAACIGLFVYYRSHDLPFYAAKFYAHLGSSTAQHALSLYYLSRFDEHPDNAVLAEHWLKRAAEGGHGVAAYNLAVAHLRGDLPSKTTLDPSQVHSLLSLAVRSGVHEALGPLYLCGHGQCSRNQSSG